MILDRIENMKGGWFVGNFEPTAYKTDAVEVSYKVHKKNEKYDVHYQTKIMEINLLTKGKMIIQDIELNAGDIFIIPPYEIADPVFLEDCEVVCVKIPGIVNDKVIVEKK
jgi:hypothetical protein